MKPQRRTDGTLSFFPSLTRALFLLGLLAGASLHADYLTSGLEDMFYPDTAHSELKSGHSIYSDNEKFALTLQPDGNLVFRRNLIEAYSVPLWQSGTTGAGELWLMGDPDNNFTLYSKLPGSEKKALWSTGTANQGEFQANLVVGDDGTLSVRSGNELLWRHSSQPAGAIRSAL
jgi:hypothetical protein